MRFIHNPLPELSVPDIDTGVPFLGHRSAYPFFVSCMTGGSAEGFRANKNLAIAAQNAGIPVGMGSIRVLFEHDEVFEHFHLKRFAPDVPVIANIGGVQLRDFNHEIIHEMLRRLEVQALAVHLNPGQELYQTNGDRDFRGIADKIGAFCERSPVPVIVKETGFGIGPAWAKALIDMGVSYIDIAGAGGTNWISVESYREEDPTADDFADWGVPTALALAGMGPELRGSVIASGGVRSGMDVAKAAALGAAQAGLALPFIRAEAELGVDGVNELIRNLGTTVRNVMALTGSRSVNELRDRKLWMVPELAATVTAYHTADIRASESGQHHSGTAATTGPTRQP